jgi:hypothetical protein
LQSFHITLKITTASLVLLFLGPRPNIEAHCSVSFFVRVFVFAIENAIGHLFPFDKTGALSLVYRPVETIAPSAGVQVDDVAVAALIDRLLLYLDSLLPAHLFRHAHHIFSTRISSLPMQMKKGHPERGGPVRNAKIQ